MSSELETAKARQRQKLKHFLNFTRVLPTRRRNRINISEATTLLLNSRLLQVSNRGGVSSSSRGGITEIFKAMKKQPESMDHMSLNYNESDQNMLSSSEDVTSQTFITKLNITNTLPECDSQQTVVRRRYTPEVDANADEINLLSSLKGIDYKPLSNELPFERRQSQYQNDEFTTPSPLSFEGREKTPLSPLTREGTLRRKLRTGSQLFDIQRMKRSRRIEAKIGRLSNFMEVVVDNPADFVFHENPNSELSMRIVTLPESHQTVPKIKKRCAIPIPRPAPLLSVTRSHQINNNINFDKLTPTISKSGAFIINTTMRHSVAAALQAPLAKVSVLHDRRDINLAKNASQWVPRITREAAVGEFF